MNKLKTIKSWIKEFAWLPENRGRTFTVNEIWKWLREQGVKGSHKSIISALNSLSKDWIVNSDGTFTSKVPRNFMSDTNRVLSVVKHMKGFGSEGNSTHESMNYTEAELVSIINKHTTGESPMTVKRFREIYASDEFKDKNWNRKIILMRDADGKYSRRRGFRIHHKSDGSVDFDRYSISKGVTVKDENGIERKLPAHYHGQLGEGQDLPKIKCNSCGSSDVTPSRGYIVCLECGTTHGRDLSGATGSLSGSTRGASRIVPQTELEQMEFPKDASEKQIYDASFGDEPKTPKRVIKWRKEWDEPTTTKRGRGRKRRKRDKVT